MAKAMNTMNLICLKKLTCISGIVAVLSTSTASFAQAPDVQPFHTLRWDDGIVEVVTKLNEVQGMSKLAWGIYGSVVNNEKNDVYRNPAEKYTTSLTERLCLVASEIYKFDGSFLDVDGTNSTSPAEARHGWSVNGGALYGGPVNLAGIEFEFVVSFSIDYGFAITHPAKVFQFGAGPNLVPVKLPLRLSSVSLSSKAVNIPENIDKLIDAAKVKYPSGVIKDAGEAFKQLGLRKGSFDFSDTSGRRFNMTWEGLPKAPAVRISYTSKDAEKFAEIYRRHIAAKAGAKSPD